MSTLFSGHYLRNRSTLDTGVLGYIGIVQHTEHSPEVLSIPPGTPCIIIVDKLRALLETRTRKYIFWWIKECFRKHQKTGMWSTCRELY